MKRIVIFLSIIGLAMSCAKEPSRQNYHSTKTAAIGVYFTESDVITKSASGDGELFDSFVIDKVGDHELKLDAYVSDVNPLAGQDGPETKGSIVTTSYLENTIQSFNMKAYANDEWFDNALPDGEDGSITDKNPAGLYFKNAVTYGSSVWSITDSPEWLNSVDMSFWSWNVAEPDTIASATGTSDYSKTFFKYTNNGNTDLIFAYNAEKRTFDPVTGEITDGTGTYNTGYKDKMNIKFYHALAAIRFDISGLKKDGFQIDSVTFSGVYSKGHCNVTGNDDRTVSFGWPADSLSDKNSFIQTFVSTDFTETGLDTARTANSLMPLTSGKFLFFIPQSVEGSVKVKISYTDDNNKKKSSEVDLDHQPWAAGKYYTYKLSVDKGLSVTVDDDLSDNVKDNLSIKYEGSKSAYIRALIVSYWVDASGNYLSNCDYKTQGTLVGLATGDWVENTTDGFFYYNAEVESGDDIGPYLLTSYTAPAAPVEGATLRMVIAAQATKYDSSKTCYEAFNSNNTSK